MVPRFAFWRGVVPCGVLLLLALSPVAYNQATARKARPTKAKEPAPHFNATATDGEKFSNVSIKGKVVLLEFWTTWCGFCAEEAPLSTGLAANSPARTSLFSPSTSASPRK